MEWKEAEKLSVFWGAHIVWLHIKANTNRLVEKLIGWAVIK
jgi:hypothetical protein